MSRILKWAFAGAIAVAMTSVVGAQEQAPAPKAADAKPSVQPAKSFFQKADINKDGKLSAKEQIARRKAWFKEMDANRDSKLTADEFSSQRFVNMDINKDGSVTMEEYLVFFAGVESAADQTPACDKLDANGDNEVNAVEVVAYRKSIYKAMDANADGKLTPEEMKAGADKQFKSLDSNSDGFVTVEEMIAVIPVPVTPLKVEKKKTDQPVK